MNFVRTEFELKITERLYSQGSCDIAPHQYYSMLTRTESNISVMKKSYDKHGITFVASKLIRSFVFFAYEYTLYFETKEDMTKFMMEYL